MSHSRTTAIPPTSRSQIDRYFDTGLLLALSFGIFSSLWLPEMSAPKILLGAALLIAGWRNWHQWQDDTTTHISGNNVPRQQHESWSVLLGFTCVAAVILLVLGKSTGSLQGSIVAALLDKSTSEWWQTKLPTVVGQQILLQLFLLPILLRLFNVKTSVLMGAVVFSLLHLPNPILMLMTLVGGLVWMASYANYANLPAVVCSHCALAILLAGCGGEYLLNMRVGWACVDIFPRTIHLGNQTAVEFPGCVVGNAERLIQQGENLVVQGWAYDFVHHGSPIALAVEIDRHLFEIDCQNFVRCQSDQWSTANDAGFVGDHCFAFEIKIPISDLQRNQSHDGVPNKFYPTNRSFRLFAANANGRWSKIGQMGKLKAVDMPPVAQAVVLFPVEIDGRVDVLGWNEGQLSLGGWAADLKTKSLANQIICQLGTKQTLIDLNSSRLPRPGIVDSYKQPAFLQSGFNVSTAVVGKDQLDKIRCFAVDKNQHLHRLTITDRAQKDFAKKMAALPATTLIR